MEAAADPTVLPDEIAAEAESQDLLTLGVEEEYLLVDRVEPRAVEAIDEVFGEVPDEVRGSVQHEYMRTQIEVASPPQLDLQGLHASMARLRTAVAEAADRAGVRLVDKGDGRFECPETGAAYVETDGVLAEA